MNQMMMTGKKLFLAFTLAICAAGCALCNSGYTPAAGDVTVENPRFKLILGANCVVKTLVLKQTGEECIDSGDGVTLFSVTQDRPFNNEIKLMYPNTRTTYQANRVRREGNKLIVGFEIVPYEAMVEVKEAPDYVSFTLADWIIHPGDYGLRMTPPPVREFRVVQLPVKNRKYFGQWLNVSWDDAASVAVVGAMPQTWINHERRKGFKILSADAVRGIKLRGTCAALVVAPTSSFLDCMESLEKDYNLPCGVQSRRSDAINTSIYWSADVRPSTVDEHIKYAKMGGFRMMLIYHPAIIKGSGGSAGYDGIGEYKLRDDYPNGLADLTKMLDKIKAAGITPGFHMLHTFIGFKSPYVTPVADHRLNLTRRFTLAKPLGADDTTVYVEENPEDSVMCDGCRILKFGGELVSYEGYTTKRPYHFTGCKRGDHKTNITKHPLGQIGGLLDVCEFGARSVYIDQNTDLQDEVAEKIARIYNAGFCFAYFDGSEGVNVPQGFHVPNAQYRVWKKFDPEPLFTEGAAKAHFSWHHLSGANAFDVFRPEIFKEKIREFPAVQAPLMRSDFSRLNFGWWGFWMPNEPKTKLGTQPDMFEYGTSRAAAWDCPVTLRTNLNKFKKHPRTGDIFEVMRRWEEVRAKKWLTSAQKEELKNLDQEHILLVNEKQEYELVPYCEIPNVADGNVRAFIFNRKGSCYVVYWHVSGSGELALPLASGDLEVVNELGGAKIAVAYEGGKSLLPADNRRYLKTSLSSDAVKKAFSAAGLK
ncbi:MAG: hypothetical protein WC340_02790 [Kiritimatiellia bacterium]